MKKSKDNLLEILRKANSGVNVRTEDYLEKERKRRSTSDLLARHGKYYDQSPSTENLYKELEAQLWDRASNTSGYFTDGKEHSQEEFKEKLSNDPFFKEFAKIEGISLDGLARRAKNQYDDFREESIVPDALRYKGFDNTPISDFYNDTLGKALTFNSDDNVVANALRVVPMAGNMGAKLAAGTLDLGINAIKGASSFTGDMVEEFTNPGLAESKEYGRHINNQLKEDADKHFDYATGPKTLGDQLEDLAVGTGRGFAGIGKGLATMADSGTQFLDANKASKIRRDIDSVSSEPERNIVNTAKELDNVDSQLAELDSLGLSEVEKLERQEFLKGKRERFSALLDSTLEQFNPDLKARYEKEVADSGIRGEYISAIDALRKVDPRINQSESLRQELSNYTEPTPAVSSWDAMGNAEHNPYLRGIQNVIRNPGETLGGTIPWVASALITRGAGFSALGKSLAGLTNPATRGVAMKALQVSGPKALANGLGILGDGYQRSIEQEIAHWNKNGTLDDYDKTQSVIAGVLGATADLYGGQILGKPIKNMLPTNLISKISENESKNIVKRIMNAPRGARYAETKKALGEAFDGISSTLSAISSGNLVGGIGNTTLSALKGTRDILQKAATSNLSKGLAESSVSLAAENAMSSLARQWGAQNGYDLSAVKESIGSGLVAGPLMKAGLSPIHTANRAIQEARNFEGTYVPTREAQLDILNNILKNKDDVNHTGLTEALKEQARNDSRYDDKFKSLAEDAIGKVNKNYDKDAGLAYDEANHKIVLGSKVKDEDRATLEKARDKLNNKFTKQYKSFESSSKDYKNILIDTLVDKMKKDGTDLRTLQSNVFSKLDKDSQEALINKTSEGYTSAQKELYRKSLEGADISPKINNNFRDFLNSVGNPDILGSLFTDHKVNINGKDVYASKAIMQDMENQKYAEAQAKVDSVINDIKNDTSMSDEDKKLATAQLEDFKNKLTDSNYEKYQVAKDLPSDLKSLKKEGITPELSDLDTLDKSTNITDPEKKDIFDAIESSLENNISAPDVIAKDLRDNNKITSNIPDTQLNSIISKAIQQYQKALKRKAEDRAGLKKFDLKSKAVKKNPNQKDFDELKNLADELAKKDTSYNIKAVKTKVGNTEYAYIRRSKKELYSESSALVNDIKNLRKKFADDPNGFTSAYTTLLGATKDKTIQNASDVLGINFRAIKTIKDYDKALDNRNTEDSKIKDFYKKNNVEDITNVSFNTGYTKYSDKLVQAKKRREIDDYRDSLVQPNEKLYESYPVLKGIKKVDDLHKVIRHMYSNFFSTEDGRDGNTDRLAYTLDQIGISNAADKISNITSFTDADIQAIVNNPDAIRLLLNDIDSVRATESIDALIQFTSNTNLGTSADMDALLNSLYNIKALISVYGSPNTNSTVKVLPDSIEAINVAKYNSIPMHSLNTLLQRLSEADTSLQQQKECDINVANSKIEEDLNALFSANINYLDEDSIAIYRNVLDEESEVLFQELAGINILNIFENADTRANLELAFMDTYTDRTDVTYKDLLKDSVTNTKLKNIIDNSVSLRTTLTNIRNGNYSELERAKFYLELFSSPVIQELLGLITVNKDTTIRTKDDIKSHVSNRGDSEGITRNIDTLANNLFHNNQQNQDRFRYFITSSLNKNGLINSNLHNTITIPILRNFIRRNSIEDASSVVRNFIRVNDESLRELLPESLLSEVLSKGYPEAINFPTVEEIVSSIDEYVSMSPADRLEVINYLSANLGKVFTYLYIDDPLVTVNNSNTVASIATYENNLRKLLRIYDRSAVNYEDFEEENIDSLNEKSFDRLFRILRREQNVTSNDISNSGTNRNLYSELTVKGRKWLDDHFDDVTLVLDPNTLLTKEDRITLAKMFANYINHVGIHNVRARTSNTREDFNYNVPANIDYVNHLHEYRDNPARARNTCATLDPYGMGNFFTELNRSSLASKLEPFRESYEDILRNLHKVEVNAHNRDRSLLIHFEGDINGKVGSHVRRTTAIAIMNCLTSLNAGKLSDSFREKLEAAGYDAKVIKTFEEEGILDRDTLKQALGGILATTLGYGKGHPSHPQMVAELGAYALVGMQASGFIEQKYIVKSGDEAGKLLNDAKAGTIPCIRASIASRARIDKAIEADRYISSKGTNGYLSSKVLGFDVFHTNETPNTRESFEQTQRELRAEFEAGIPVDLPLANAGIIQQITDVVNAESSTDANSLSPFNYSNWIARNNGVVAIFTGLDDQGNAKYYFSRDSLVNKPDHVMVSDQRLVELARQSASPKYISKQDAKMFTDAIGQFIESARIGDSTEIDYKIVNKVLLEDDPKNSRTFADLHPDIAALMGWEDPSNISNIDSNYIKTKNMQNLKNLIRDYNILNNMMQDSANTGNYIEVFYDSINTVNNRLFIDCIGLNFRENKILRDLYELNSEDQRSFKVVDTSGSSLDTASTMEVMLPILHINEEIKIDKMQDDQVGQTYNSMTESKAFQKLIVDLSKVDTNNPSYFKEYAKAIKEYNDSDSKFTQYFIDPKTSKSKESQEKLPVTAKTILGLKHLVVDLGIDGKSIHDYIAESKTKDDAKNSELAGKLLKRIATSGAKLTNYRMKVEVDGLTNGPSIKCIQSYFRASGDPTKIILLGAVGISRRFTNFADALEYGQLDTYLINGAITNNTIEDLSITEMLNNGAITPQALEYLNILYTGKHVGDVGANAELGDVLKSILVRDVLKYPVMYTGYSAGKATIVQKMLSYFDIEANKLLAKASKGDTDALKRLQEWLKKTRELNGNNNIRVFYESRQAELDANGNIIIDGNIEVNVFSNTKVLRNITYRANLNSPIMDLLSTKILEPMFDSLQEGMNRNQTPYQLNQEAAVSMANVINALIQGEIKKINDTLKDYTVAERLREFGEISKRIHNQLRTQLQIGTDGTRFELLKNAIEQDVISMWNSQFITNDGQNYQSANPTIGKVESKGAGVVPFNIHSYDSQIVHWCHQYLRSHGEGELESIHDAVIVNANQLYDVQKMNKFYFYTGVNGLNTFVSRDNLLRNFISKVSSDTFGDVLDKNQKRFLLNDLNSMLNKCSENTDILLFNHLKFYTDEKAKTMGDRYTYNQYALTGNTAFTPANEDLDNAIKHIKGLLGATKGTPNKMSLLMKHLEDNHKFIPDIATLSKKLFSANKVSSIYRDSLSVNNLIKRLEDDNAGTSEERTALRNYCENYLRKFEDSISKDFLDGLAISVASNAKNVRDTFDDVKNNVRPNINNQGFLGNILDMYMAMDRDCGNTDSTIDPVGRIKRVIDKNIDLVTQNETRTFFNQLYIMAQANNTKANKRNYSFERVSRSFSNLVDKNYITSFKPSAKHVFIQADNFDFDAIATELEKTTNLSNISEFKTNYQLQALNWFNDYADTLYKDYIESKNYDHTTQIVVPLRSLTDVVTVTALNYLKTLGKLKANIAIAPYNTSDILPDSVDKEAYALNKFANKGDEVHHILAPSDSKNNTMLSMISGIYFDEDHLGTEGSVGGNEPGIKMPHVIANRSEVNGYQGVESSNIIPDVREDLFTKYGQVTINRFTELGSPINSSPIEMVLDGARVKDASAKFTPSDALNIPRALREESNYESSDISKMSEEDVNNEVINSKSIGILDIYAGNYKLYAGTQDYTEAFCSPDTALVIPVDANGDIVGDKLAAMLDASVSPEIAQAISVMKNQRAKDIQQYTLGNQTNINEILKPRHYIIKNWKGSALDKSIITVTVADTTISKDELKSLKAHTNETDASKWTINTEGLTEHFLKDTLKGINHASGSTAFTKWISDSLEKSRADDARIFIPKEFLDTSKVTFNSNSRHLRNRNALYMEKLVDHYGLINKVMYMGDHALSKDIISSPSCLEFKYFSLEGYSVSKARQQGKDSNATAKNRVINNINSYKKLPRYGNSKIPVGNSATNVSRNTGYARTNMPEDFAITDEMETMFLDDKHSLGRAIDKVLLEDAIKGRDNSYLSWQIPYLRDLNAKIHLIRNKAWGEKGIKFNLSGSPEVYIKIGTGSNVASEASLLFHEIGHEILKYRHVDPSADKAAWAIFNYLSKNLKVEHFDCDPKLAQELMDRMFHHEPGIEYDNVEETLVNVLCNEYVQRAVSKLNMAEEIDAKAKGIFGRLMDSLISFSNGTLPVSQTGNVVDMARAIYVASYKACNEYWEGNVSADSQDLVSSLVDESTLRDKALSIGESFISIFDEPLAMLYGATGKYRNNKYSKDVNKENELMPILTNWVRKQYEIKDGFINDLLASFEGVSKKHWDILKLRLEAKHIIDQQRDRSASAVNNVVRDLIKDVPREIEDKLPRYLIKTDIASLFNSTKTPKEIKELLVNQKARNAYITELESMISTSAYGNFYKNAAKGLGQYLATGFNPTGIAYRNAHEIVTMAGTNMHTVSSADSAITSAVDKVATLHAIDFLYKEYPEMSKQVYDAVSPELLKEITTLHSGIKQTEINEVYGNGVHAYHIPKGELHGAKTKHRYTMVPESQLEAYKWSGYKDEGVAVLDPFYSGIAKEKYHLVSGKWKAEIPVVAGVMATTDIFKGRAKGGLNYNGVNRADVDIDKNRPEELAKLRGYITQRVNNLNSKNPKFITSNPSGNLVPNFDALGNLTGSNFELNPDVAMAKMGREYKMSAVLGDLYGSVVERANVPDINNKVAEATIDMYERAKNKEEFSWVSDSSEKEQFRNYYSALPYEIKKACRDKYGDQGVPVLTSALNTYFGYESISANKVDLEYYTKLQKGFVDYASHLFHSGPVGNAETLFRWMTKTGKDNIVIKGLTTSMYNLMSNCATLSLSGLSVKDMVTDQLEGLGYLKTLNSYSETMKKLQVKKLNGTYNNADARTESNIKTAIEKMPIYPLIKAGAISNTLAEDITESDTTLKDFIDDNIPKGILNDLTQDMLLTSKSRIYQLMVKFANCGDSIGKIAYYKHLRKKGVPEQEAIRQCVQMFIDYSNPTPRLIQYADDLGSLPFIKFALGIQTTILNTIGDNPHKVLAYILGSSALGLHIPDIYSSVLGLNTITDRLQVPGLGIYFDSFSCLPSIKSLDFMGIL